MRRLEKDRSTWSVPGSCDAVCTAFPYVYGSQRRGHPNLARALGVHNLNESAGGFAGLATAGLAGTVGLANAMARSRRIGPDRPPIGFLAGLGLFGGWRRSASFRSTNLLRAVPVLDVTDNRRLTLWLAFSLVLLGGDRARRTWPVGATETLIGETEAEA